MLKNIPTVSQTLFFLLLFLTNKGLQEKYFLGTSIITQFVKWALKLGGLPWGLEYKAPDAAAVTLDPERWEANPGITMANSLQKER